MLVKENQQWVMTIAAITISSILTGKIVHYIYRTKDLKHKVKRKQDSVRLKKSELQNYLNQLGISQERVDSVLSMTTENLLTEFTTGKLKATDVLRIYQLKALQVDEVTQSITETISGVEESAKILDAVDVNLHKLLHGLPVSIKSMISIKGYDCPVGLVNRCFLREEVDAVIVQVLKYQGALPFAFTNMAQLGCSADCSNPIFGETCNPWDKTRTCGGSSGGEGALIGGGGSVLGIGTDVGGSIRIPSSHCGISGFKPTAGRLSMKGLPAHRGIFGSVETSIGPMAKDVDTCVLAMRALLCSEMFRLDSTVPPIPFNEKAFTHKKLRIGMYTNLDGCVHPIPAVVRAVNEAAAALRLQGHEVVPFEVPDAIRIFYKLFGGIMLADQGATLSKQLKGDITDESLKTNLRTISTPRWLKMLLSKLVQPLSPLISRLLSSGLPKSNICNVWSTMADISLYRQQFLSKMEDAELDALICPVSAFCAPPLGATKYLTCSVVYTALYNILNFPAGSVPVTRVSEDDMASLKSYALSSNDLLVRWITNWQAGSVGLPLGVQCVAKPWMDEVCLRVMKDLEIGIAASAV